MIVPSWPVALERMTITIASYQRRTALLRLLHALDDQLSADEVLRRDLEIVVVLDGSTDGSREEVERTSWVVPTRVIWQPNRGLAAARNVGLAAAEGGLVWFLDDDLIPSPGLVERHREAHHPAEPRVVVGPCRIPPETGAPEPLLRWWNTFFEDLEAAGGITRFDLFTAANASAPAELLTSVGGFDETFVTYGLEDYELGFRLLRKGIVLAFEPAATAWHPDIPTTSVLVGRQRSIGLNAARFVQLHPDVVDILFKQATDPRRVPPARRLLRHLRLRSPRSLMAASHAASALHVVTRSLHPWTSRHAEHLARAAAHAAGVAEGDPTLVLLRRELGQR